VAQKRKSGFQVSYVTITYRSVLLGILMLLALASLVAYFTFPAASNRLISAGEVSLGKLLAKMGLGSTAIGAGAEPGPQLAHFTNIDGTVRVKKASSNTWVQADYGLALEQNDVIQTSPEGIAKVVFTDGTNYTVKPDSLIVIQENSLNSAQQTRVAVQVTTGTVDLATATVSPGSKSQVNVAGASLTIAAESSAEVQNDPRHDEHAILMKKGSGEVTRGEESVKLGDNEKVSFTADAKEMVKTKEMSPPFLIGPFDKQQVSLGPADKGVLFYWSEVEGNVRAYHLKVSKTPFFSPASLVFDKNVTGSQIILPVGEGTYYWVVQSVGENGKESVESPRSQFTLVPKGSSGANIALELGDFVQHGHVIEVSGRTETGARVMVNGQEAVVNGDGTFHHFTNPLPTGDNMITVTAQNAKGGVNTKQQPVTIQ
jgi:Glucodextranase, domain B/FecR protein